MTSTVDWDALRVAGDRGRFGTRTRLTRACTSGAAGIVDDGRVVTGCNVENASYGLGLCAECTMAGQLRLSGGGRLVAVACRSGAGDLLMPCGRCRQILFELGGSACLVDTPARGPADVATCCRTPSARTTCRERASRRSTSSGPSGTAAGCPTSRSTGSSTPTPAASSPKSRCRRWPWRSCCNGMDSAEIARWTHAMIASGERLSLRTSTGRRSTSTPPAGSATRSRCRWRRWWPRAARRCRSCPGAASATPAGRWTSWSPSRAGGRQLSTAEIQCAAGGRRRGGLRGDVRARAGGQKLYALRDVTVHRGVDPADRQLDHEQEDRRRRVRAGPGREVRVGRVHEDRWTQARELASTLIVDRRRPRRPRRRRC